MAYFTTRIELSSHDPAAYARLDALMEKEGFKKTVTSGNTVYLLPLGEYNYIGKLDAAEVREAAKRAAEQLSIAFCILVTESKGKRQWHNLPALNSMLFFCTSMLDFA